MLPLIFSAGDGKKGIFMPLDPGILISSLCCLKNIGVVGATCKVKDCIESKGENYLKNTEEVETSGSKKWHLYLLFSWRALEQRVCKYRLYVYSWELLSLRTIYI